MNNVEIKNGHLYITTYDYRGKHRDILPLEDIECIKAVVGARGGMHHWSVKGYSPEYSETTEDRDVSIFSGGRKNDSLIDEIQKLLPDLKYYETVESGGAPW